MIKYTKHNLNKLEDIFRELKITLRYEKGNFHSGYCIVSGKNIGNTMPIITAARSKSRASPICMLHLGSFGQDEDAR